MDINKSKLIKAATKADISQEKVDLLWNFLSEKSSTDEGAGITLSKVLYYFGAVIVLLALGWLADITWEQFGGKGLLAIALTYMCAFIVVGTILWRHAEFKTAGGLFITLAVCLIPMAVYGLQRWTGWWGTEDPGQYKDFFSWVKGGWFFMEMATIVGGVVAIYFYRFPFLTAPIFAALWFLSMDITPLVFGNTDDSGKHWLWMSMIVGIAMLGAAYIIDRRTEEDYAFWGYLFGVITFWSGVSWLETHSEWQRLIYLIINLGLIFAAIFLERVVFLIFGSLGVLIYIVSLFYKYFSDSPWFPLVLSLLGVVLIFVGVLYQKKRQHIEKYILNLMPITMFKWRPTSRDE